jgi:hypothetical protein
MHIIEYLILEPLISSYEDQH